MKKKMMAMLITTMMISLVGCGNAGTGNIDNTENESEKLTESTAETSEIIEDITEEVIESEIETEINTTETIADDNVADDNATNKSDKTNNEQTTDDKKTEDKADEPVKDNEKPADDKIEDKHTHSYDNGKVTKNATCTQTGVMTYTCSCGKTKTEEIAKVDHQYDNGKVTTQPTCANTGEKTYTCKTCNKTRIESIEKTAHNYDNGTVTKQPTCNATGQKTFACACGATYTEDIPAVAHEWKHFEATGHEEQVLVKEAWDEDQYEAAVVCGGCGKTFTGNGAEDAAIEHLAEADFFGPCQNYSVKQVKVGTIHHEAEYTTKWIQDTPAYDQCTKCGTKK